MNLCRIGGRLNNFHTHTKRCLHAEGTDREYVGKAIEKGFKTFGFSDHSPWPYKNFVSKVRMKVSEFDGYVTSIRALQEEFKDKIEIKLGLECEYFKEHLSWLIDLKESAGLDYLIFGNHYIGDEEHGLYTAHVTSKKDLYQYLDDVEAGIGEKIFSYVCHPDIIFANYSEFDSDCVIVSKRICELSKSYDIPLEYNLLGKIKRSSGIFSGLGYPYEGFWDIVREEGCKVILGLDAHSIEQVDDVVMKRDIKRMKSEGFNLVDTIF